MIFRLAVVDDDLIPTCENQTYTLTATNWAALGILYNTGQDCTAGSRVYVQDTIYDKCIATLIEKAKALVIGDAFDDQSGGGPVVRDSFFDLSCVLID